MAQFLTTLNGSAQIENIIRGARSKLILISPFIQISETFHQRLKEAAARNVKISIVYGKDEMSAREKDLLAAVDNLGVFFLANLHAKCYCNERQVVITSMNLYHYSEKNNKEMGVSINVDDDRALYDDAMQEVQDILAIAQPRSAKAITPLSGTKFGQHDSLSKLRRMDSMQPGYCIRCSNRIPHNVNEPLCTVCYSIWSQYNNHDYTENNCHQCGTPHKVTKAAPECGGCARKNIVRQRTQLPRM